MWKRLFRLPGSYTVEAVFLMPMIIFLLAFVLYVSMDWYESVRTDGRGAQRSYSSWIREHIFLT